MSEHPHSVYRFYTPDGTLLYIGCTGMGTDRLKQHSLTAAWWPEVATVAVEHFPDRKIAFEREAYLIETLGPLHNVVRRWDVPAPVMPPVPTVPDPKPERKAA